MWQNVRRSIYYLALCAPLWRSYFYHLRAHASFEQGTLCQEAEKEIGKTEEQITSQKHLQKDTFDAAKDKQKRSGRPTSLRLRTQPLISTFVLLGVLTFLHGTHAIIMPGAPLVCQRTQSKTIFRPPEAPPCNVVIDAAKIRDTHPIEAHA